MLRQYDDDRLKWNENKLRKCDTRNEISSFNRIEVCVQASPLWSEVINQTIISSRPLIESYHLSLSLEKNNTRVFNKNGDRSTHVIITDRQIQSRNEKKKGEGETLECYPHRLCTVSMNYVKGDSPCRLLVDLDVERRYLHVASDSRIALYSLDEFQREKGKCNRVSAAGGGGGGSGGGLDLDLASLIRSEGGQPPLCDSLRRVWGSRLLRPADKDKGHLTVALDKNMYIERVKTMLEDEDTYMKILKDPTSKINDNLRQLLAGWKKQNYIFESTYRSLYYSDDNISRDYALPKAHKINCSFRIIISSLDSTLFNLGMFLHELIALSNRWVYVCKNCNLPKNEFLKAVRLMLDSTYFVFDNQFYKQTFGTPMGSKITLELDGNSINFLHTIIMLKNNESTNKGKVYAWGTNYKKQLSSFIPNIRKNSDIAVIEYMSMSNLAKINLFIYEVYIQLFIHMYTDEESMILSDLKAMIVVSFSMYVGLWTLDSNSSAFLRCSYHIYNKSVLTIMLVFIITLFADICMSFDDLSIVTDDGCIFAGIIVVFFKVMIFQTRHEKIIRLVRKTIDSCFELCKFPIGVEDEILDKYLLLCRVIFYGFSVLGFFLVIALLFVVPVENGELPVRAQYPFDTTVYPWHEIGFFVEACTVSIGVIAIIMMDGLLTNLCNLFLMQLEILNAHFKNCAFSTTEASCEKDNYDPDAIRYGGFAERFGRSIRNHQRLLAIIDDFNEVFSAGMFVQMLSSTSMICLTGFQAALVIGQSSNTLKFAVYLMAALSQLFYVCWLGNEVKYQSASLTQSQWLSKWNDDISAKPGRLLILSMIFLRKAINLKAGVFYALSMETFTAVSIFKKRIDDRILRPVDYRVILLVRIVQEKYRVRS
ncbi:Putative odorant receptor 71a [Atta colombica]|uniref:Putative odorant receptor 71a n=1 Tax=Atta colombica TaxID=520822 RepID=A0A195BRV4_9HYME|nr:Putative odorant receptor 71a [Atta colombica]